MRPMYLASILGDNLRKIMGTSALQESQETTVSPNLCPQAPVSPDVLLPPAGKSRHSGYPDMTLTSFVGCHR